MNVRVSIVMLLVCVSGLVPFQFANAVSSNFRVQTLVGSDTTPPTVPASLTATPIATSQINLAWGASVDDFMVSGYQVFRDDVQIATTTVTSYSDVGLTASTTYTYYVTAFDAFNNFSASSTPTATTTLASTTPPVVPPEVSGSQQGSLTRLGDLISLKVIPTQRGVLIQYETSGYVRSVVRWGTTSSYELGSVAERSFSTFHETTIDNLIPNTKYSFTIQGENHSGVFGVLTESTFRTLPLDDVLPPSNVSNLRAVRVGDDIVLSWQNPEEGDFSSVRVLRSDAFYPSDTADGWVVYEGDGESVRDKGSALLAPRQFYTVFTYDTRGNISSGAVVAIQLDTNTSPEVVTEKNPMNLNLDMIGLFQDGVRIPFAGGVARINGARHLTIAIPYTLLPEHLKTILVTLTSPQDSKKELNFLLRVNKEKDAYVAFLAPLGVSGEFPLRLAVFDFKTTQIGYTSGRILSEISTYERPLAAQNTTFFAGLLRFLDTAHIDYVLWFLTLLILLMFLARRLLHSHNLK